jgi:tetratricopeptide (TPR) repeat protein
MSALLLGLAMALPVDTGWAAGSGSSGSSSKSSSSTSEAALYDQAQRKVYAGDYRGAIPILEKVLGKNRRNADALNLMGFCNRKLGNYNAALDYYQKALAVNSNHVGANEYLGELYLELNDLARAEERLTILVRACNGCAEQKELEEKIAAYKANNS